MESLKKLINVSSFSTLFPYPQDTGKLKIVSQMNFNKFKEQIILLQTVSEYRIVGKVTLFFFYNSRIISNQNYTVIRQKAMWINFT